MALTIGIVGLPNVGKSTLFNALTKSRGAQAANYPFCTIDPNVGIVEVPDTRLQTLTDIVKPEKVVPTAVSFVDIAGLVKGASKGEGLGNQFLHHIREADAICQVVRAFGGGDIIHVEGSVDPKRDREIIETELMLADLDTLKKRIDKNQGGVRSGDKAKVAEGALLEKMLKWIEDGKMLRLLPLDKEETELAKTLHLLTLKPLLYAVNVAEHELKTANTAALRTQLGVDDATEVIPISAKIEEDLQDLNAEETKVFLDDLGVTSSGLDRLIASAYKALGLITYFTAGVKEVRAWTVHVGATAPQAAGVIHTDFERGFICAETIAFDDYVRCQGEKGAKEQGKMRTEGKTYIVKDGDVMHFRFNV